MYVVGQGCSSPIVVKFADTQKDKEQKRMAQQLQQQMQQLNAASMWGNLTGLNSLGPQYLAVSTAKQGTHSLFKAWFILLCPCICEQVKAHSVKRTGGIVTVIIIE